MADLLAEMTLRTIEVRERRDRFRPDIPVGILSNSRQAGIDTASTRRSSLRIRGLCGI